MVWRSKSTAVIAGPADENGRTIGPLRVCGYIPVDDQLEDTQKIEQGLWYLGAYISPAEPDYKQIQEVKLDSKSWKEHYHPIPIGNKLIIPPASIEPAGTERIPIRIDLGMAFGTGTHPTTQLCLALAEELIPQLESGNGIKVIDIGCGSGILSIAGLSLEQCMPWVWILTRKQFEPRVRTQP